MKTMCRNSIVDKLVEECKIVDYNETLNKISSNDSLSDCVSCTPYIVLFSVFLVTSAIISAVFIYFYWHSKKEDNVRVESEEDTFRFKFNPNTTHTLIN